MEFWVSSGSISSRKKLSFSRRSLRWSKPGRHRLQQEKCRPLRFSIWAHQTKKDAKTDARALYDLDLRLESYPGEADCLMLMSIIIVLNHHASVSTGQRNNTSHRSWCVLLRRSKRYRTVFNASSCRSLYIKTIYTSNTALFHSVTLKYITEFITTRIDVQSKLLYFSVNVQTLKGET